MSSTAYRMFSVYSVPPKTTIMDPEEYKTLYSSIFSNSKSKEKEPSQQEYQTAEQHSYFRIECGNERGKNDKVTSNIPNYDRSDELKAFYEKVACLRSDIEIKDEPPPQDDYNEENCMFQNRICGNSSSNIIDWKPDISLNTSNDNVATTIYNQLNVKGSGDIEDCDVSNSLNIAYQRHLENCDLKDSTQHLYSDSLDQEDFDPRMKFQKGDCEGPGENNLSSAVACQFNLEGGDHLSNIRRKKEESLLDKQFIYLTGCNADSDKKNYTTDDELFAVGKCIQGHIRPYSKYSSGDLFTKILETEKDEDSQIIVEYRKWVENVTNLRLNLRSKTKSKAKVTSCKRWKKNLYENRDYPDNYTDVSFLEELKKNLYIRELTFKEAFFGAALLTQQLCHITLYASCFVFLYNEWISPAFLIIGSSILGLVAYGMLFAGSYNFLKVLRSLVIYLIGSYLFAPILQSLTSTVSTDSIFAMSVIMMCTHLVCYDYGMPALIVSSSMSLNAAVFSSVCLASRLTSITHAFALMHITVMIFAISPIFSTKLGLSYTTLFFNIIFSIAILATFSTVMTIIFIVTIVFVNILCPYYFVKWHSYKDNIYGPWDEAVLNVTACNL